MVTGPSVIVPRRRLQLEQRDEADAGWVSERPPRVLGGAPRVLGGAVDLSLLEPGGAMKPLSTAAFSSLVMVTGPSVIVPFRAYFVVTRAARASLRFSVWELRRAPRRSTSSGARRDRCHSVILFIGDVLDGERL